MNVLKYHFSHMVLCKVLRNHFIINNLAIKKVDSADTISFDHVWYHMLSRRAFVLYRAYHQCGAGAASFWNPPEGDQFIHL